VYPLIVLCCLHTSHHSSSTSLHARSCEAARTLGVYNEATASDIANTRCSPQFLNPSRSAADGCSDRSAGSSRQISEREYASAGKKTVALEMGGRQRPEVDWRCASLRQPCWQNHRRAGVCWRDRRMRRLASVREA
jgi:hypothetical protein